MASRSDLTSSSMEYSLLGLLGDRPMHGYELHRELRGRTGLGLIWTIKQAQLYALLAKLESEGLIAAELSAQGNRPTRRVFHLTHAGRAAFDSWLRRPSARRDFRLDFLAKLFFARRGDSSLARALLTEQRRLCALWLGEMRERGASCRDGSPDAPVYRFRIGQLESMLAWLDECIASAGLGSRPRLCEILGIRPDPAGRRAVVVALVGAGGKTSALFALARELRDFRVIATATTRLRDPRAETGRSFDRVAIDGDAEGFAPRRGGGALVVASASEEEDRKLIGMDPSRVEALRESADFVLVEADGARGLSIKAPASWEPVVPGCADLVVGVVGLDCLGKAVGPGFAHRPEILGPLVGCAEGEPLRPEHLLRLARAPEGLFKGAPSGARRAIVLNKADAAPPETTRALVEALAEEDSPADAIVACSLRDGNGALEIASSWRRAPA